MTSLEKLLNAFENDLSGARQRRGQAITEMNVADAEIRAASEAIDRVKREIREGKEPKKA